MPDRNCETCGKRFKITNYKLKLASDAGTEWGRFCSRKCRWEGTSVTVKCPICWGWFTTSLSKSQKGHRYCSRKCSGIAFSESKGERVEVQCGTCGKRFFSRKKRLEASKSGNLYCSDECMREAQKKFKPINCAFCGKEFRPDYDGKLFCSCVCSHKARASKPILQRCKTCGRRYWSKPHNKRKFCSQGCCKVFFTGEKHHRWEGGKSHDKSGYPIFRKKNHTRSRANGYVSVHVLVMEAYLGRSLEFYGIGHPDNEVVHHIDRNKKNFKIWNLELCLAKVHSGYHANNIQYAATK